jgi:hypothetical protein
MIARQIEIPLAFAEIAPIYSGRLSQLEVPLPWIAYVVHFIAAAFLTNGIPHFVNGVSGRSFRTPFGRANGSSPEVNVVWGWVNFLIAFLLFANIGPLYIGTPGDTIFVAAGMLVTGIILSRIFASTTR